MNFDFKFLKKGLRKLIKLEFNFKRFSNPIEMKEIADCNHYVH